MAGRTEKKKHHTQTPHAIIKRALEKKGYLHAAALSMVTGQSLNTCKQLCSGEIPIQGNGLPRIAKELGINKEDLR